MRVGGSGSGACRGISRDFLPRVPLRRFEPYFLFRGVCARRRISGGNCRLGEGDARACPDDCDAPQCLRNGLRLCFRSGIFADRALRAESGDEERDVESLRREGGYAGHVGVRLVQSDLRKRGVCVVAPSGSALGQKDGQPLRLGILPSARYDREPRSAVGFGSAARGNRDPAFGVGRGRLLCRSARREQPRGWRCA